MSRFVFAVLVTLALSLGTLPPATAASLPSLPLPDCVANGLTPNANTDCEGVLETYAQNQQIPRPAPGQVKLAISAREVDFRLDADSPQIAQLLTFSFTFPAAQQATAPNGTIFTSKVGIVSWPERIVAFASLYFTCKQADEQWSGGCDGQPYGNGPNPDRMQLERQGTCADTAASCTYRVTWGPYDRRVRERMLYRIGFQFYGGYTEETTSGTTPCGTDPLVNGCPLGGGIGYVTYETNPPPPLDAVAKAKRRGAKVFEFDSSTSGPDVVSRTWSVQVSDLVQGLRSITSTFPTFTLDFDQEANIPASFFQAAHVAQVEVVDRWNRHDFGFVQYSFLDPAGTEGALKITSFVLVGVDQDGLATLKATIENTGDDELTDVYVIGRDTAGAVSPKSTPQLVDLEGHATAEFTITVQFDQRQELTVEAKAFGTAAAGPVKSKPSTKQFDRDGTVKGKTFVSQASQPGDHTLHVESNDGFNPGDYVVVNIGGENVEARPVEALGSLIFKAPLSKAHAVGEEVRVFPNTAATGDVTPPQLVVTSPVAGAVVCQGASYTAAFTCSDSQTPVDGCGEGIASGQALDTSVAGAKQTTILAWDILGNFTEKTIAWTVVPCAADIDPFRCYPAKPAAGSPKFAPIAGVRVNGAFDDVLVNLTKPAELCLPADTTADGFVDPETHLQGYALKLQKGQPKPAPRSGVAVLSQAGALVVDTAKAGQVLLPTAEDPFSSPSLSVSEVDRFLCYAAKLSKGQPKLPKDLQLTVADGFTAPPKRVTLKKLARLCTPVGADGGPTKHDARLLCFQVASTKGRCADAAPVNAGGGCKKETDCGGTKSATSFCATQAKFVKKPGRHVVNDLDTGTLDATKEGVLCLPAVAG